MPSIQVMGACLSPSQPKEPDIPTAFNKLKETGVKRIIVTPVFLAHGMHTKRDIPTILGLEPADIEKVSAYAKDAVTNMFISRVLSGNEKGEFMPKEHLTRAQAAKIIFGVLQR